MRIIFLSFTLIWHLVVCSQEAIVDKVVARVGSEYILLSEVEDEWQYFKSQNPGIDEKQKCLILDNIVAQKLIVYQAKLDSVEVSDDEVNLQLDYRFDAVLKQMNGDEAFFEDYYGATIDEMKSRYRDDQKSKLLAEKMQYTLMSEIHITPQEVEEFYNRIPKDSLPYFKSEMEISEIVVAPQVNAEERSKALNKITDLRDQIISGKATFEDLAKKYSQDPGSAIRGGDLGFAKRGTYVPEFEAAIYTLEKNEISDVIETEFGFHIIEMLERRGNAIKARHILIKPEITESDKIKAREKLDSIRIQVKNDSISFERAVKQFSLKTMPSYANGGRVKNEASNNTFFQADDLDPDTYFAIYNLKTGDISNPVESKSITGESTFKILKLVSITKPHKANLKEDFDKIASFAKESKKQEFFLKWLREKKAETYIHIDDIYGYCKDKY
ncbi:MAG: peptidylprolyl isomerase [Saprospiraceae bacterium]